MVIIKRMYSFMLERFLPLLTMTFFICLFIVMMQFLWRFVDELVGKGLEMSVIAELFFYAAVSMVPTALPLAVLLASLMTFGNLGEKFELTAIKAAGISLFRVMKPLTIFMVFVAVGAFFFQNNILPIAQTKMWALLFSVRHKSPEVEIPEKSFYQINRISILVDKKNRDTGMLYDLVLYDTSKGQDNRRVILADSGRLNFTEDKTHIYLHLYNGELFEDLRDRVLGSGSASYKPFRRETFRDKEIYIAFDQNLNRYDEEGFRNQYVGRNISELTQYIDSMQVVLDSLGTRFGTELKTNDYVNVGYYEVVRIDSAMVRVPRKPVSVVNPIDIDSLFMSPSPSMAKSYITAALGKARQEKQNQELRSSTLLEEAKIMRRNDIERQRKFTLSFACLIFFFIGAPLGAIIKKGGLGTPLVISVIFFIIYFIIDNFGYKMARDGKIAVWLGIWMSSIVLLPIGVFFTYKAAHDSQVFNIDAYINFLRSLLGKRMSRSLQIKEVIIDEVDPAHALNILTKIETAAVSLRARPRGIFPSWRYRRSLAELTHQISDMVDYLSNARDKKVIVTLNKYPFVAKYRDLNDIVNDTQTLIDFYQSSLTQS